jgi:hypothetical protein
MNSATSPQYKPVYYLQRPFSPKNIHHVQSAKNISLTMSIGNKQSPLNFISQAKMRQDMAQKSGG